MGVDYSSFVSALQRFARDVISGADSDFQVTSLSTWDRSGEQM